MKISEILEQTLIEEKPSVTKKQIEAMIRKHAKDIGINPDAAVMVWKSEGYGSYQSTVKPKKGSKVKTVNGREASFGPFQLYTGGGLGNDYEKKYGVKLANDNTPEGIERQIEFALKYAATSGKGWKPWYGPGNTYKDWDPYYGINKPDNKQSNISQSPRPMMRPDSEPKLTTSPRPMMRPDSEPKFSQLPNEPETFKGPETKVASGKSVKDVVSKSTIDKDTKDELNKMFGQPKNSIKTTFKSVGSTK